MCGDLDTSGAELSSVTHHITAASVVEECESQPPSPGTAQLTLALTGAASYICINVKW